MLDDLRELYGYLVKFKESAEQFYFDETVDVEVISYFIDNAKETSKFLPEMESIISKAPNYNGKRGIESSFIRFKDCLTNVSDLKIRTLDSNVRQYNFLVKELGDLMINDLPEGFTKEDVKVIQTEEADTLQRWKNESRKLQETISDYVKEYKTIEKIIRNEIDRLSNI